MIKTRLSAKAADAANSNTQANDADFARMGAPTNERTPSFDRRKTLRMINHGDLARRFTPQTGFLRALDAVRRRPHGNLHERVPRHLWHLPRDYELAIRWLRPSFLS